MLITSLVLSLFDNSIFLGHLLCLMPLNTQKAEERLPAQRETIIRLDAIASISPPNRAVFIYFIHSAASDCCCAGLLQPLVKPDSLINIFHLFSGL